MHRWKYVDAKISKWFAGQKHPGKKKTPKLVDPYLSTNILILIYLIIYFICFIYSFIFFWNTAMYICTISHFYMKNALFDHWGLRRMEKCFLTKAAGKEPSGEMRDHKLQAVVVRSTIHTSCQKSTCGSGDAQKVHSAALANVDSKCERRSGFGSFLEVGMLKWKSAVWRVKCDL
jgi:hypothetical protein